MQRHMGYGDSDQPLHLQQAPDYKQQLNIQVVALKETVKMLQVSAWRVATGVHEYACIHNNTDCIVYMHVYRSAVHHELHACAHLCTTRPPNHCT